MNIERGTLVLVNLNPTKGHEQHGVRPCIVVSDFDVIESQRYPLVAVVPVTGTAGRGALYPRLEPGQNGLTKTSYALTDHIRSIDKRRISHVLGTLHPFELAHIDQGLRLFLGL